MNWISFSFIIIGYYALHSVMASSQVKTLLQNIGIQEQAHRILFNLIALATTYVVFISYQKTINKLDYDGSNLGFILIVIGAGLVLKALFNYDLLAFIGLTKEKPSEDLIISGLNGHLRHPLYLGILIGMVGWIIVQPTSAVIAIFLVTLIYVQIGIHFEEVKLINQFGEKYVEYKRTVPKLIPRIKK